MVETVSLQHGDELKVVLPKFFCRAVVLAGTFLFLLSHTANFSAQPGKCTFRDAEEDRQLTPGVFKPHVLARRLKPCRHSEGTGHEP